MLLSIILLALTAVAAAAWALRLKHDNIIMAERVARLTDDTARISAEADRRVDELCARHEAEIARATEEAERRIEDLRQQQADSKAAEAEQTARFKAIASEVLAAQSASMREQQENRLGLILQPLRDELDGFRKSITDNYNEESRQRFSLSEHIKLLIETNNSIGREAKELSRALKGNSKIQGDWGEMILESILEKSGLKNGEEYTVQATTDAAGNTLVNDDGARLRPDIVLHYPSRGDVIIDSKVSLKDYTEYINADDDATRGASLERHLRSVRKHIRELRDKRYQDFIGAKAGTRTLDFVMMFIPNEGAYMSALQADTGLWQEALESRVLIVSPTHLVSVLSMIHQMWAENRQNRNAIEIADAAGKMYEKFVGFVTDMEKIKKNLDGADKAYSDAMSKLRDGRGNLMTRAENLKELGAKTSKQLNATR